jgi:hypothetical protein
MEITLKLSLEQVNGIIYALGELPVKTGAAQLVSLIHEQVQPQVPEQPAEQTEQATE